MCLQLKEGVDEKDDSEREEVCDKVVCTDVGSLGGIRAKKKERKKEE